MTFKSKKSEKDKTSSSSEKSPLEREQHPEPFQSSNSKAGSGPMMNGGGFSELPPIGDHNQNSNIPPQFNAEMDDKNSSALPPKTKKKKKVKKQT